MARVKIIPDNTELYNYYYADTICGLIEYLHENIAPEECEIFAVYLKKELTLNITYCTDKNGKWLTKPFICNSLEQHFKDTQDEIYKGHIVSGSCDFDDRDTQGSGPY